MAKKLEAEEQDQDRLWKHEDAMAYLRIPRSTYFMHIAKKEIPVIKIGKHTRLIPEQVKAWAKRQAA